MLTVRINRAKWGERRLSNKKASASRNYWEKAGTFCCLGFVGKTFDKKRLAGEI